MIPQFLMTMMVKRAVTAAIIGIVLALGYKYFVYNPTIIEKNKIEKEIDKRITDKINNIGKEEAKNVEDRINEVTYDFDCESNCTKWL